MSSSEQHGVISSPTVQTFGRGIRREWLLDEDVLFLNHGSFGATPRRVLEAQSALRARMEREPVAFLEGELPELLRAAAAKLAAFVGASGDDLVFIDNATTGVNAVVGSLQFEPGDEIATTTHMYGAVRKTLRHLARRTGVRVVEAPVPFPLSRPDEAADVFVRALGPRTHLAILDHVTSASALVMPVERLVAACRERGIPVLIDGAHAPGMLPLDVPAIGADFYVGNCHKWLFAPKGCAFLWAHRDRQGDLHPTVISHGLGKGFLKEFDWTGTKDPTPWLAVTEALAFVRALGAEAMRDHNRRLAATAAEMLASKRGTTLPAPPPMRCAMITLPVPGDRPATDEEAKSLHDWLLAEHRIEVPVLVFNSSLWLRISAQVYNEPWEYERLAHALDTVAK